jgi:hypothetical protein
VALLAFRALDSIMNYGHSEHVSELGDIERAKV